MDSTLGQPSQVPSEQDKACNSKTWNCMEGIVKKGGGVGGMNMCCHHILFQQLQSGD